MIDWDGRDVKVDEKCLLLIDVIIKALRDSFVEIDVESMGEDEGEGEYNCF